MECGEVRSSASMTTDNSDSGNNTQPTTTHPLYSQITEWETLLEESSAQMLPMVAMKSLRYVAVGVVGFRCSRLRSRSCSCVAEGKQCKTQQDKLNVKTTTTRQVL